MNLTLRRGLLLCTSILLGNVGACGWFIFDLYRTEVSVEIAREDGLIGEYIDDNNEELIFVAHGSGGINIYQGRGYASVFETRNGERVAFDESCHSSKNGAVRELRIRLKNSERMISPVRSEFENVLKSGGRIVFDTGKRIKIASYDGDACITNVSAPNIDLAKKYVGQTY